MREKSLLLGFTEGKDSSRMFPQFVREVSHNTSFQPACSQEYATVCVEDGLGFTHC